MIEQVEAGGLCLELSCALASYLEKSASNSLSKVQHLTGIDYKTLKKLSSYQVNLKNLNPLKVARLANLVLEKRSLISFFKLYRDELNSKLVDFYLAIYAEKVEVNHSKKLDPMEFEVFCLCANYGGASIEQISELGGLSARYALERLLDKSIVEKSSKHYVSVDKSFHYYERDHLKKHITEFSKKIKLKKKSDLRNYLMYAHEALNLKGVEELEKLTATYHKAVLEIMDNKFYKGRNHYFVFLGYDSNIDKDYTLCGGLS